jgi:DNA-binding Lrp family transcriptional regulator
MQNLTQLQKQLCTILQKGIPVCQKPFAEIADNLNVSEKQVLDQIRQLKETGIIRRFRAIINPRSLGNASTLVTAHVPEDKLHLITQAINSFSGVSHNYLREHFYNLWFTLQEQTETQLEEIIADLHKCFEIDCHSLPVVRTFKLDVQFNVEDEKPNKKRSAISKPLNQKIELNTNEKKILTKLQKELEITEEPFSFLSDDELSIEDVLNIIISLIEKGVIRRIAAVLYYQKLGFNANALFACEVPEERIIETGEKLAQLEIVSHCYQRKTFDGWPYNLFAMLHGHDINEINEEVNKFIETEKIISFQLLPSTAELKKEPVHHNLQ